MVEKTILLKPLEMEFIMKKKRLETTSGLKEMCLVAAHGDERTEEDTG